MEGRQQQEIKFFSYQLNRISNKTLEEVEEGANTNAENFKKGEQSKNEHRKIRGFKGPFPGFRKNLYEYLVEYSSNTSIQGIRYIGQQTRPIFERIAWLLFFCVSLYFCIYLIVQTYIKWDTSPVLVSFARSPTPVWKVPFPAITICSEVKAQPSIYNFTANYHRVLDDPTNMTEDELKKFANLALVCDNHLYQKGNLTTGYDTIDFLMKVAPGMQWICQHPFSNETCQEIFTPTLTEEGICYTFNMLDRSEVYRDNVFLYGAFMSHEERSGGWTLGEGYPKHVPIDTYPRRSISAGFQSRFTIVLFAFEHDLDYVCRGPIQGYKIIFHNPAETPQLGTHYFRAPHRQEVIYAIKPDMITTSDGLRNYNPHRRQCYFPEERYLAYFRRYTQKNCKLECLANFTRTKCGCVAYQMPHEKETPICGSGSIKCMLEAKNDLVRREVQSSIDEENLGVSRPTQCDCLPGCTSLVYNAETSQADFNWDKLAAGYRQDASEFQGVQVTRINIFLKEEQFITSERNELYGQTDFLANCGGLLGLFTGFSFLSLVEICYFLSLRLIGNIKRYGIHYWSGSQELVNNDNYDHQK